MSDAPVRPTWLFPIIGGTRSSYEVGTFDELLRELEHDYRLLFGEALCIDPEWRSTEGETLYPQKEVMFHLANLFVNLRTVAGSQVVSEENGRAMMHLLGDIQGILSRVAIEARIEGRLEFIDWFGEGRRRGELLTAEDLAERIAQQENKLKQMRRQFNQEKDETRDALFRLATRMHFQEARKHAPLKRPLTFGASLLKANEASKAYDKDFFDEQFQNMEQHYRTWRTRNPDIVDELGRDVTPV